MRKRAIFAALIIPALAGCKSSTLNHKLVTADGQRTVPMYSSEGAYLRALRSAQQSGMPGLVGDVRKTLSARQIQDRTAVKLISQDSNGAMVQITDGPLNGQTGFVATQNID